MSLVWGREEENFIEFPTSRDLNSFPSTLPRLLFVFYPDFGSPVVWLILFTPVNSRSMLGRGWVIEQVSLCNKEESTLSLNLTEVQPEGFLIQNH